MTVTEDAFKKLDEVWTKDQKLLGLAQSLHIRQRGADPDLQLYEDYLEVENYDLGEVFYVPTEFIKSRIDADRKIIVSATFAEALSKTWARMPDFVAHGDEKRVDLPGA